MRGCITLGRQYNFTWSQIWWIGSFLVVLALAGCGGQLGRIEPSEVDTAIATAAAASRGAADSDAATLVPETFGSAQSNLEAAKEALSEKQGSEALRLA